MNFIDTFPIKSDKSYDASYNRDKVSMKRMPFLLSEIGHITSLATKIRDKESFNHTSCQEGSYNKRAHFQRSLWLCWERSKLKKRVENLPLIIITR